MVYEESKHLLMGDYEVLEWCRKEITDEVPQKVFNKLLNEFSTTGLPNEITEFIEVVDADQKEVIDSEGKKIHRVPYLFFQDSHECQMANIIGEDNRDPDLYVLILKWFVGNTNFNFSYKIVHGGGVNTATTIVNTLSYQRIAVTIIDSDRRYPGDRYKKGSTLHRCLEAMKQVKDSSVFNLHVLDVHEIENILPFDLLESFVSDQTRLKHFQFLAKADQNGELLKYFDLKEGIKKSHDMIKRQDYREYAKSCYSQNPLLTTASDFMTRFNSIDLDIKEADKTLYPGLEKELLQKTIDYFSEKDIRTVSFTLRDFQEEEWKKIGQNLLNFSIARSKESII